MNKRHLIHLRPNRLILAAVTSLLLTGAHARTWTSADGTRTFAGELKSYDAEKGMVTVILPNGRRMSFNQAKLSEADITYVKENGSKATGSSPSSASVKDLSDVLPDPDGEEADMSKPVQVYILMGQSNMLGFGKAGALQTAAQDGNYP